MKIVKSQLVFSFLLFSYYCSVTVMIVVIITVLYIEFNPLKQNMVFEFTNIGSIYIFKYPKNQKLNKFMVKDKWGCAAN